MLSEISGTKFFLLNGKKSWSTWEKFITAIFLPFVHMQSIFRLAKLYAIHKVSVDHWKASWKPYENYSRNHSSSTFQSSLLSFSIFYESISSMFFFALFRFVVNGMESAFHWISSIQWIARDDSLNIKLKDAKPFKRQAAFSQHQDKWQTANVWALSMSIIQ